MAIYTRSTFEEHEALRQKRKRRGSRLPSRRRFVVAGQSNAGVNVTLLDTVAAQITGDFSLDRVAYGGTGFSDGLWLPQADGGPGTHAQELFSLLDSHPAKEWRAVSWNQWEKDAATTPAASVWGDYTKHLIDEMRSHTWYGLWVFLVLANPDSSKGQWSLIRSQQEEIIAADPRVSGIDMDDVTIASGGYDNLHYVDGAIDGREIISERTGLAFDGVA